MERRADLPETPGIAISADDRARMARFQRAVSERILQIQSREPLETGLAVMALTVLSRELLDLYPPRFRDQLIKEILVPFLQHKEQPGIERSRIITLS
jgi:hypothetical protein